MIDLEPPAEAGTLRFHLRHDSPPASPSREGRVFFDDISLILWEGRAEDASGGLVLQSPNSWSWLRFRPAHPECEKPGLYLQ